MQHEELSLSLHGRERWPRRIVVPGTPESRHVRVGEIHHVRARGGGAGGAGAGATGVGGGAAGEGAVDEGAEVAAVPGDVHEPGVLVVAAMVDEVVLVVVVVHPVERRRRHRRQRHGRSNMSRRRRERKHWRRRRRRSGERRRGRRRWGNEHLAVLVGGADLDEAVGDDLEPGAGEAVDAGELLDGEGLVGAEASLEGVVEEDERLPLVVVAVHLAQLLLELADPEAEEVLLVHHLLALLHLRQRPELPQHVHGHLRRRPHLWLRVPLPVHHQARVHVAQRRQLARLLQQPAPPLLERRPPRRVVGDAVQDDLLASHG